jgi:CO/xanthine dehydrogenase Mo-binding subunit
MLRSAAAKRWGVALAECRAVDGAIVHVSGKRLRYGEVAEDAAHEKIPEVTLKPRSEHKVIGKPITRLDARMKVDGSGIYGIDVQVPDMVNACVARPPVLGAEVARVDDAEARKVPGVIDVVRIPQGVAVVAHRYWQARRALAALKVEWRGGETWIDSEALRKSYLERARKPATAARKQGNVDEGVKFVEAIYEAPYLAHATMEPQNATAIVTGDRAEIWAPTQAPGVAVEAVRRITGLAYDRIIIHQTLLGGGFGRRLEQDYVEEAVQIALRVKRPVKVTWSREEDMRHSQYRPMTVHYLRGGLDAKGNVVSYLHRVVGQSIVSRVAPDWAPAVVPGGVPMTMKHFTGKALGALVGGNAVVDPTAVDGISTMTYAIPNFRVEYAPVVHAVPVTSWRSVGASQNVYVVEAFLDELARAAGRDPFELRRSILPPRDRRVLELAAEKAGWGKPLPPGRFRGIAQAKTFETYCAEVAEVSVVGREVKVHKVTVATDCGIVVNPDLVRAQVESAIIFGLGAALKQEITYKAGRVEQGNFGDFEPLRLFETPEIDVHVVPSDEPPTGVGEPGVPPIAPAVVNAILAATGRPVRTLPITRFFEERR